MRNLAIAIVATALVLGVGMRLGGLLSYVDFYGDEGRDALRFFEMHAGIWPTLGPEAQLVHFRLPPLYYYAVAPITWLGTAPVLQAIPNAIFSIASIVLLGLVVRRLLAGIAEPFRNLIAALAMLWWSVTFVDVYLANREWNPTPIPFTILALVLLWSHQADRDRPLWDVFATAAAIGALLAFGVSLHASALYVFPVAFAVMSVVHIASAPRDWRTWLEVGVALGIAAVCLTPYWIGEVQRGWTNTRQMVESLRTPGVHLSLFAQLRNAVAAYLGLASQFVVPHTPRVVRIATALMLALLMIAVPFALRRSLGERRALVAVLTVWVAYLFAASHVSVLYPHYRLPIAFAPIVMAALIAGATYTRAIPNRIAVGALTAFATMSILANVNIDREYLAAKFGPQRPPTADDIATALRSIPTGASLCVPPNIYDDHFAVRYLNRHVARRELRFTARCAPGDFLLDQRYDFSRPNREDPVFAEYRIVTCETVDWPDTQRALHSQATAVVATTPAFRVLRVQGATRDEYSEE